MDLAQQPKRGKPWRAPSWSWAGVDSPVKYFQWSIFDRILYARVIHAEVEIATSDPTGRVTSGSLKIYGRLQTAKLYAQDPGHLYPFELRLSDGKIKYVYIDYDILSEENPSNGFIPLHCLRLAYDRGDEYSLVLKLIDESKQLYERVGFARQRYHEVSAWTATGAGDDSLSLFAGVKEQIVTIV